MNELVKYEDEHGQLVSFTAQEVKQRLCPSITDSELALVMGLCQAQNLNPFTRDVYIIKYGNSPASIVTGKEVFTKRAKANPNYKGFEAGIVYLNQAGQVCKREGSAIYKAAGETLVGGWCRVFVDGCSPFYEEVTLDEYSTGKSGWAKMPATMIRKVALVHCLREAFPSDFQGLYCSEEMGKAGETAAQLEAQPEQPLTAECVELATDDQVEALQAALWKFADMTGKTDEQVIAALLQSKTMQEQGVTDLADMDSKQAEAALGVMRSWIAKKQEEQTRTELDATLEEMQDIPF